MDPVNAYLASILFSDNVRPFHPMEQQQLVNQEQFFPIKSAYLVQGAA